MLQFLPIFSWHQPLAFQMNRGGENQTSWRTCHTILNVSFWVNNTFTISCHFFLVWWGTPKKACHSSQKAHLKFMSLILMIDEWIRTWSTILAAYVKSKMYRKKIPLVLKQSLDLRDGGRGRSKLTFFLMPEEVPSTKLL